MNLGKVSCSQFGKGQLCQAKEFGHYTLNVREQLKVSEEI